MELNADRLDLKKWWRWVWYEVRLGKLASDLGILSCLLLDGTIISRIIVAFLACRLWGNYFRLEALLAESQSFA